ncbi:HD-GYP domain-containing protein [Heliorestis acidaminivorans]|uniref:HD-GYP domain-containing protein n=1 Tax=Heliorestis acidaminivorans TaxID=553427 RepID=A0A6I0F0C9_9FIRM|nr:HD-GYP domain-containing protein [Heliorestis acidaminivorans]KAB2951543.1 HD-GYP domain-containing protein [Heliorestis acidaminivorans]
MLRISIELVEPGTVLARPVYDGRGGTLLGRGVILTPSYIQRLKEFSIPVVYIEGPLSDLISYENVVSDRTYTKVIKETRQVLKMLTKPQAGLDISSAQRSVESILDDIMRNRGILLDVTALHDFDETILVHSVSVCVLSVIIGMQYNMSRQELYLLGVGALLHDIGMVNFPKDLVNKPAPFTEEEMEIIHQHPIEGFKMLRKTHLLIAHAAFQHQERYDGSGYPRGLKGNDIHLFGRIVAVADVFDALTSSRPHRKAWSVRDAYEYTMSFSGTYFDPEILRKFSESVAVYPNGTIVKLSNGTGALVVKQNKGFPLQPVVFTLQNNRVDQQYDLLALENSDITIIS